MQSWLKPQQCLLSEQLANNKLPHANLVVGVEGSGKSLLVNWLVSSIHCTDLIISQSNGESTPCGHCKNCQLIKSGTFPDHISIQREKNSIGVDSIRKASKFFEKTAQLGRYQTVVIEEAESMTTEASNALLKTLEEPTTNSFIILIAKDIELLLQTILSRSNIINIRPPSGKQLANTLSIETNASPYTNLTHLPELTDETVQTNYREFEQAFIKLITKTDSYSHWLAIAKLEPHSLRWLEKIVVNLMRSSKGWLEKNAGSHESFTGANQQISEDKLWLIFNLVQSLIKKEKLLSQLNKEFFIEKLGIDIITIVEN